MNRKLVYATVILFFTSLTGLWLWQKRDSGLAPQVGFTSLQGERIELSQLKHRPVIVTFWASDCPACIGEIPELIELHHRFKPMGLTIIAVAMYYDPPNRVLNLTKTHQLPYIVTLDPDQSLASAFGNVQFTPTTFLIDKSGHIAMKTIGAFDRSELEQRIERLE